MPIPGETSSDYIYSAENIVYGEWKKYFVLLPVKTVSGRRVWFRSVYTRTRHPRVEPPQFRVGQFKSREWATWEEIAQYKLSGTWT